jgi:hypothetical protein
MNTIKIIHTIEYNSSYFKIEGLIVLYKGWI